MLRTEQEGRKLKQEVRNTATPAIGTLQFPLRNLQGSFFKFAKVIRKIAIPSS